MPAPVIEPRTSLQVAKEDESFIFQLAAFNTPTSWTALYLPPGLSINASTGLISGTPTTPGLYQTAIRANNDDGHDQIFLLVTVLTAEIPIPEMGEWNDLILDFDLVNRTLTASGGTAKEGSGLFPMGKGDSMNLLVGFWRGGKMWDVNPNGEEMTVKFALKEFEPEILLTLNGGVPEKVVIGDQTRYRITVAIDPATWGPVLSNYEEDERTVMLPVTEIELRVGQQVYAQTKSTSPFSIQGAMTDGYGENAKVQKTLTFDGLVSEDESDYTLDLLLSVPSRPSQSVQLARTLKLAKPGGTWVVSSVAGPSSVQGADDGDWRVTMLNTSIDGLSGAVDVDVEFSSTAGSSNFYLFELPTGVDLTSEETLTITETDLWLYDLSETLIPGIGLSIAGGATNGESYRINLRNVWNMALGQDGLTSGVSTVHPKEGDPTVAMVYVINSGVVPARALISHTGDWVSAFAPTLVSGGTPATATLQGTLAQTSGAMPARYTAQTTIELMRDLVPDV